MFLNIIEGQHFLSTLPCLMIIVKYHNSVNCDRPGECSPEKDCLR